MRSEVFPEPVERPENRGYSILKPGAEFDSLERVQTITGQRTDLSRYPARRGFEDLVMLVSDHRAPFAWTAVTFPRQRYVWFALKDPRGFAQFIAQLGEHDPQGSAHMSRGFQGERPSLYDFEKDIRKLTTPALIESLG